MSGASGSTILNVNGTPTKVEVEISFEDIDINGVAWCEPVRKLIGHPAETIRLIGTLIVVAAICRESDRSDYALGALRMARRMTAGSVRSIGESIAGIVAKAGPNAASNDKVEAVSYASEPLKFLRLLNLKGIGNNIYHPGLPYAGLVGIEGFDGRPERPEVDNVSFLILVDGRVAAVVPMIVYPDHVASWIRWVEGMPGMPAEVFCRAPSDRRLVYKFLGPYLKLLSRSYGIRIYSIQEDAASFPALSRSLGSHLHYALEVWDRPVVDLTRSVDAIYKNVRKSYKSSINWGRDNLQMRYLSGSQLDDARVAEALSALRKAQEHTYSRYGDAFDRQLFDEAVHMCKNGDGEVSISYLRDGGACGVVITSDAGGKSYYALGGATLVRGNRSPSHWNVFNAIQRAKLRGNQEFHLGRLFGAPISIDGYGTRKASKREIDLTFFKHGFSDIVESRYVHQIPTDAI